MKMKLLLASLVIILFTIQVKGQVVISLPQAIHDALNNRQNIQAVKLNSAIIKLQTQALNKKYFPQISLDYTYQYNPILQSSILPIGKFNTIAPTDATERIQIGTTWSQTAGITAIEPLLDFNIKKQITENRLQERISLAVLAQTEYELVYEVTKAYINIWIQEQQIQSTVIDSARTWVSFKLQKDKFETGKLLKSDLNKAVINHNNVKQKVSDAVSQVVENKVYLMFLIGQPFSEKNDIDIDTGFFKKEILSSFEKRTITDSIPELEQFRLQKELTIIQKESEKTKYLPIVNLKGFLGANQYTSHFNPVESNSWFGYGYLALVAKLPLSIGEDKQKKLEQLQIQSEQYDKQRIDKTNQYTQEAITAKLEISRLQNQMNNLQENLRLSQESLGIIQNRVLAGQETASYLNTEELELQRISTDYANIQKQTWLYWLNYLKASGLLKELWK